MAINPAKLTQSDLLQVINATPLGVALSRPRLRRQMDAGALRFGDGTHIHLVRYVRWLVDELNKPRPQKIDYTEARRRQAERSRQATKASQDIFPIPEIEDYERRKRCGESFRLFCETYFPAAFHREWSNDHLRVIAKIEKAVREGGLFAFAMPRGSGKTTLARCSALWAVLYGYRPFVCLIGAADDRAKELLLPIKKHIVENPLLLADFPESIHPLRCLENSSKRQLQQHIQGRLTHVHWGQEKLVFPTIEGDHLPHVLRTEGYEVSPSCGSIITTTSLDANMRGQQHTRADGSIIRPSLVLLDDPQTRQSAASATQTRRRLELLNGDVLGMAGPGEQISAVLTCTKIYDNDLADQVLDKEKNPEWDSECTRLVYAFPTNEKLWDEYKHIRDTQGHKAATEYYRRHREEMDAGAVIAWPARFDRKSELSAIQHAMNLKFKVGPEAFASEYQNEPVLEQTNDQVLTVEQVLAKVNGYKRGSVPAACTKLTMFIDLHDRLLFYCVCAWEENFTGYVIDYGTFPQQKRYNFTLATAPATLGRAFPGLGTDGAIHAGLERLVSTNLAREWKRGETLMRIDRLLVDMGYKPGIVADVKRKAGGTAVMASKGIGIRASRKPLASYMRHPGEVHGHFWYIPNVRKTGEFPHVLVDVNYWKTFVHAGLATAAGDRGCLSLFGKDGREHDMFAEHVAHSETWVEVQGMGRIVHEWSSRPTRPDNHWFDCLVGCAAAASMCGVKAAGEAATTRPRKRYARGIVLTLANDVIGTGPRLQMLTDNDEANRTIESEFAAWAKEVDLPGRLRTMRMARAQDGEAFALLFNNPKLTGPVKLDIRLIEADQVATPDLFPLRPGLMDGIVFDAYGNPVEYHVLKQHPGSSLNVTGLRYDHIPAASIVHWFRADRPGQSRGLPDIMPALPLFAQLRRYTLAVIAAAESAANIAVLMKTNTPAGGEAAEVEPMTEMEFVPNMAVFTPEGWEPSQVKAEQPATTYDMFKREILNEIARCLNIPYNIAACNSSAYNYASGRLDHQTYYKSISVEQTDLELRVLDRIFAAWLGEAILISDLLLIHMRTIAFRALAHQWFWDGHEHVDPAKEANAQATRLANHTTTLANEYARQGRDWEVELRQRAKEVALMEELGLTPAAANPQPAQENSDDEEQLTERRRAA